ncbi:hypothetical protein HER21_42400, partial [Pseudomonas sp. BGM005]|nr:hypothetical protein [Pseudomonas sp. BG5]
GDPYESHEREVIAVRRTPRAPLLRTGQAASAGAIGSFLLGTVGAAALVGASAVLGVGVSGLMALGIVVGGGALATAVSAARMLVRALRDRSHP